MKIGFRCGLVLATLAVVALLVVPGSRASERRERTVAWRGSDDSAGDFGWAVVGHGENGSLRASGSTDGEDWRRIKALAGNRDDLLWFRVDGRSWMTRDPRAVSRAREILVPMQELGRRQGALGRQQGALGRQQGALGREMGRIGREQGRLGARLAAVTRGIARAEWNGGGARDLERERERIEDAMDGLAREIDALSRRQEPLAQRQDELGRQQEELGRRQEAASRRAQQDMQQLARDLIRQGRVETLDD